MHIHMSGEDENRDVQLTSEMCNWQIIRYDHYTQSESDDSCCFHMSGENEIDV